MCRILLLRTEIPSVETAPPEIGGTSRAGSCGNLWEIEVRKRDRHHFCLHKKGLTLVQSAQERISSLFILMPYFIPGSASVYFCTRGRGLSIPRGGQSNVKHKASTTTKRGGATVKTPLVLLISSACIILSGCMSQQSATKQPAHEFIAELPNHPRTELYDRVVKWMASSFKSVKPVSEYQDKDAGSIVSYVHTEIKPADPWVNMPIGFTMNVDLRNGRMRVRFTDLRRLYNAKKFQEPLNDEFFKTSTSLAYRQAAHLKFSAIVESLTYFIEQGKLAAGDTYTPLSDR